MENIKKLVKYFLKFNFVKRNIRKILIYISTFFFKNKKRLKSFGNYDLYLDVSEYTAWSYFYKNQEKDEIEFIKKIVKDKDNIIDIGANLGYYSLLFSSLTPNGKIFSFEPSLKNYKKLQENIKLNKKKNIKSYQLGLSNKKGIAKLFLTGKTNLNEGGNFISLNKKNSYNLLSEFEEVKIDILDDIVAKKISFKLVKIDTEGNELLVLKGMRKILENNIRYLLIETSSNFDDINKFLIDFNFKVYKKGGLNSIFEKKI